MFASTLRRLPPIIIGMLLLPAASGLARERTPAPEPVASRATTVAADNLPAVQAPAAAVPDIRAEPAAHASTGSPDKAGGMSVTVQDLGQINTSSMDVAADGRLYAAASFTSGGDNQIAVHRSADGGATWETWGTLGVGAEHWYAGEVVVAEGDVDRCYLVARKLVTPGNDLQMWIAWADLSDPVADFAATAVPVLDEAGVDFDHARLIIDDSEFSDFYLYLVAEGDEGNGTDIWFARSTSFGATWETPYTIATMNVSDRHYVNPDIAQGQGGRLHVAWNFDNGTTTLDDAIRVRSVERFGDGGSSAWEAVQSLTSTANDLEEYAPRVGARWDSRQVVVTERRARADGPILRIWNPGVFVSADAGTTFVETVIGTGLSTSLSAVLDLRFDGDRSLWVLAGRGANGSDPALSTAPAADPAAWSAKDQLEVLGDGVYLQDMDIVLDPSRGGRVAALWHDWIYASGSYDGTEMLFDAEWRGDPGWPVPLAGFPVALPMSAHADPCLADLDGDGDLEILCRIGGTGIGAWHHDGEPVTGWPVYSGNPLGDAPLAVGDLDGDGVPLVFAGTDIGDVLAIRPDGTAAWYVPAVNPPGQAYVSVGAFGGPEPRQLAVFENQALYFIDSSGEFVPGTSYRFYWGNSSQAMAPAAIGDVDGDGLPEAVFSLDDDVYAVSMRPGGTEWSRSLPGDVAGSLALLDMDDDGDVEVVVPTRKGQIFLLDDGGMDYPDPGWPFETGTDAPLTGVSAASISPGGSWEIAFADHARQLHVVGKDGSYSDGFPVSMPAELPVTPVLAPFDGDAAELFFPDDAGALHVWHYKGGEMPGWPVPIPPGAAFSPSVGDLDNDGILDAVWLTEGTLHACSIGQPAGGPREMWPMAHFDVQRTGCIDCDENLVSGARDENLATLVSFAAPWPNPVHDQAVFAFVLPRAADASLQVFDLRGRRVASLLRGSLEPGVHRETWTGRDDHGRAAASGHYVAQLRVDGEVLSRKITLVR